METIGDIWMGIYKRKDIRHPAAELIVGYLSEFIDNYFLRSSPERAGGSEPLKMPRMDEVQMACGNLSAGEFRAVKAALEWFVRRHKNGK